MTKLDDLNLLEFGNTIQPVGSIWAGGGRMFLCMFPAEHGYVSDIEGNDITAFVRAADDETVYAEALNMTSEEWVKFLRQTDILETEVLATAADGKLTKAILRKSARQISQHISWEVFRRDGYACRYCGRDNAPLTVDHLVTWEEGGPSVPENLVAADKRCNKVRGNLPYEEWLEHPHYKKVSANLTEEQRDANRKLAATLKDIPRMIHKPTRR